MSRYDPSAPRAVFGLLAVAMAATTMAVFVVLPAQVEAVASGQRNARGWTCALTVGTIPSRADVRSIE